MSVRRWHRWSKWPTIKTLAEKGKPGTMMRRIAISQRPSDRQATPISSDEGLA